MRATAEGRVVLLDRDGTLIEEKEYLHDPEGVSLLPGVGEGLRELFRAGFRLGVVTNQSGIGRGYYSEADMRAVNSRMEEQLSEYGVRLAGIWFCPHAPNEGCQCRKPAPGMALAAAAALKFSPEDAFVVGDKPCDVELARAVGAKAVLVRTGYGAASEAQTDADFVAENFAAAAHWIATDGSVEK